MRIYEGAPRQNYEDILRSVGAILDQRGMREVTVAETDDGFMVQGLAVEAGEDKSWGDPSARQTKETFYLRDDDIARLMDEAVARRQGRAPQPPAAPSANPAVSTKRRCGSSARTSTSSSRATSSSSSRNASS